MKAAIITMLALLALDLPDPPLNVQIVAASSARALLSVVSRKQHSVLAAPFDVDLLNGADIPNAFPGIAIEPRLGPVRIVFKFSQPVKVDQVNVTQGIAPVVSVGGSGTDEISVNLGDILITPQVIMIELNYTWLLDSTPSMGANLDASWLRVYFGVLAGDINGSRAVTDADVPAIGAPVGAGNFRHDLNCDGVINASDAAVVTTNLGQALFIETP